MNKEMMYSSEPEVAEEVAEDNGEVVGTDSKESETEESSN